MATITLDFLPKGNTKQTPVLYSDLHFDLSINNVVGNQLFNTNTNNDIKADYDLNAVRNSVINIFTTSPGEKILSPNFGLDLRYYLFEPCDEDTANNIADTILRQLPFFEPRVNVDKLDIEILKDQQTYNVNMQLSVPSFNLTGLSINGQLNSNGYTLI